MNASVFSVGSLGWWRVLGGLAGSVWLGAGPGLAGPWTGGGADGNWTTPANWEGGVAPVEGDILEFGGSVTANANDFPANTRFDGITFLSGATPFTLAGNAVDLGGNVTNLSGNTQYVGLDLRLKQDVVFALGSQALVNTAVISEDGGAFGVTKTGTGTWHPRRANTYTGTTLVKRGIAYVDFNAAGTPRDNMFAPSSALEMGGDLHNVKAEFRSESGKVSAQTFGSVRLRAGRSAFPLVRNGTTGSMTLNLGSLTREKGSFMGVSLGSTVFVNVTPSTPLQNGILGAWAQAGTHWITHSGGALAAYSGYTVLSGDSPVIASSAAANVTFDATCTGTPVFTANADLNTLRCSDSASRTVDLGGYSLRLGKVGGLWRALATSTADTLTLQNGSLTSGGTTDQDGELVLLSDGTGASATAHANTGINLNASITDNGTGKVTLLKTGAQAARLGMTNTYSGDTYVLRGRLISAVLNNLGGDVHVFDCPDSDQGGIVLSAAGDYTNNFFLAGMGPTEQIVSIAYSRGALCFATAGTRVTGTVTLVADARIAGFHDIAGAVAGKVTGNGGLVVGSGSQAYFTLFLANPANDWKGRTLITTSSSSGSKHVALVNEASEVLPHGPGKGNVQLNNGSGSSGSSTYLTLNGFDETINGLDWSGTTTRADQRVVRNNSGVADCTLTLGAGDANGSYMGVVVNGSTGKLAIRKIGTGTQVFSWACSHTGGTTVENGTLEISGSLTGGSVAVAEGGTFVYTGATALARPVNLEGGLFIHNSTNETGYTGTLTFSDGGGLGGTNWLGNLSGVTINTDRRIAPGASVGMAYTVDQNWANGGTYEVEIADATGGAGVGWDHVAGSGTLDLTGLTGAGGFTIKVASLGVDGLAGACANFDQGQEYVWPIATFASLAGTFDGSRFAVDTGDFANEFRGSFNVVQSGAAQISLRYADSRGTVLMVR